MTIQQRRVATFVLFLISILIAFLAVEFSYRRYLAGKFSHAAFPASFVPTFFAIGDVRSREAGEGLYFPNLDIPYRHFSGSHDLLFQSRIRTNNLGYRANRDWSLEKPAGEIRIAVLGDSLTAALMSDYAWTDVAERELNADPALLAQLGVDRIGVLNFGIVGAGFDTMAQVQADHSRRFTPDLTVVAFISPDILRSTLNVEALAAAETTMRVYRGLVDISTARTPAETIVECDTPVIGLGVTGCRPSTVIRVDEKAVFDAEVIREVKLTLSRGFLWDSLWRSTYPYAVAAAMGKPFQLHDRGLFEFLAIDSGEGKVGETDDQAIHRSAATLQRLRERAAPLLILHLPTVTEIQQSVVRAGLAQTLARSGDLNIRFLGENPRLKSDFDQETLFWFNLPHDSHLSTKGVEIYGKAFAEFLIPELRALRIPPR